MSKVIELRKARSQVVILRNAHRTTVLFRRLSKYEIHLTNFNKLIIVVIAVSRKIAAECGFYAKNRK